MKQIVVMVMFVVMINMITMIHHDNVYNLLEEVEEALVVSDLLSSVQQRVLLLLGESVSAPGVNHGPAKCRIRILSLSIFQVFPYSWSST